MARHSTKDSNPAIPQQQQQQAPLVTIKCELSDADIKEELKLLQEEKEKEKDNRVVFTVVNPSAANNNEKSTAGTHSGFAGDKPEAHPGHSGFGQSVYDLSATNGITIKVEPIATDSEGEGKKRH